MTILDTQAQVTAILACLSEGKSLRAACREQGMPAPSTFLLWCDSNPVLAEQYARARATGADIRFDELESIAEEEPERDDKGRIDPAWVALQRLKTDSRKWALSKQAPKKYGEKLDVEHAGRVHLAHELSDGDLARIAAGSSN